MPLDLLGSRAEELGLELDAGALRALDHFVTLLERWNRAYNLTAARDPERIVDEHVVESLAAAPHLPPGSLLDIGSGGGFPGMVLAIVEPERAVTLLDSNGKKVRFLRQCAAELRLARVSVVHARAEDLAAGAYDVVTARAVTRLDHLIAWSRPFLAPGGVLAAFKGTRLAEELECLADEDRDRLELIELPTHDAGERSVLVLYHRPSSL